MLTEHVTAFAPDVLQRIEMVTRALIARGMSPTAAHQQALMVMDRTIGAQASVLAFSKIYILSGTVLMFSIPLMLFWKHGRGRAAMQAH